MKLTDQETATIPEELTHVATVDYDIEDSPREDLTEIKQGDCGGMALAFLVRWATRGTWN